MHRMFHPHTALQQNIRWRQRHLKSCTALQLHIHTYSHPPCCRAIGQWASVWRAKEQLEPKLRQDMEIAASQQSPLQSLSADHPPVRLSPCPLTTEFPPLRFPQNSNELRITQGEITATYFLSKDRQDNLPHLHISHISGAIPTVDSHMMTSSLGSTSELEDSPLDTSAQSQIQSQGHSQSQKCHTVPKTCSNQITVGEVTVQEDDTYERLSSSQGGPGGC